MPTLGFNSDALRRLRRERGLSQPEFGRPLKTVCSWEQGWRVPPLPVIGEIADALGVKAKVGRWERTGTVENGRFTYTDAKGETKTTKFTVIG
ncbi:predicted protein [Streptomyces viridochromogenes DSM 40736]|uniref:Predicted protein n=1 Tax=Streptomyces viridochromogenes (strain DSM 40736 / JCM 4977 / BCRC 1201 / Tue 494) TaxID=591159 RepID=D9X0C4_STRVT|nr:predicted protein [Streptomyces viridochromogenes DSM 40736]